MPYDYVIPIWVYCVNNKICTIIHIHSKVQEKCGFNKIILFMHSLITQMHEQLFIYIYLQIDNFYIEDILIFSTYSILFHPN